MIEVTVTSQDDSHLGTMTPQADRIAASRHAARFIPLSFRRGVRGEVVGSSVQFNTYVLIGFVA